MRNGGPTGRDVCLNHLLVDRGFDGGTVGLAFGGVTCVQGAQGKYVYL